MVVLDVYTIYEQSVMSCSVEKPEQHGRDQHDVVRENLEH
jgi:hypothetical protein